MSGNSHSKMSPKANHLINEKSPYLLQHAQNPVDWYPWGEEAFRKAKTENKPIFLSIGYSSCHWCHVMAHESFEDENVAKFLNDNFVSIKVDREERPDVDEIYMKSVMSTTGSGGWPLSVFLTPSLEPFFGGTYFPASPRYGMPSFMNLLKEISRSWKTERKNLVDTATQIRNELKKMYEIRRITNPDLNDSVFHDCYGELASSFDENYGGFGQSPKFPMPTNLLFLLRYSLLRPSSSALRMATKTLDSMMRGGIYDQVGGGFHRYSTDRYWIVPHFEKMLYDNALLSLVYCEAFQITKKEEYARIVMETLEWVLREMRSQEGGFYSAQDADSPEGEGVYYLWDLDEVHTCLKTEIASPEVISDFFSITSQGNFEKGKSILTAKQSSSFAENHGLRKDEIDEMIQASKEMMRVHRNKRPKPSTDDKILTSWNGLMISALSKAYCVTGTKKYLEAAIYAAEFVLNKLAILVDGKMKILRSYRDGESKGEGVLEDYSNFMIGLIDLFEACYDPKYLETAVLLCESMLYRFHDKQGGALFMTDGSSTNLIVRPKDAYDGATPSGNSMAALACVKLSEFTARKDFEDAARDIFVTFWSVISSQPSSFTEMLVALQFFLGERKEIVISGDLEAGDAQELIRTLRSVFLPSSITVLADERLQRVTPLVHERVAKKGERARAYVCSNFSCKMPISSPEQLMEALRE